MPRHAAALSTDLAALADLTAAPDRREVEELRRRLEADVFRVLVVGEANRGKSTLVNALLGRSVLPTGVVPLTALPSTLVHGDVDEVEVSYADGRVEVGGLDGLAVVTEDGNPHNRCGVAAVTVRVAAPLLATGLELVDTPGTGSVYEHNTAAAVTALGAMDAAILVLSADPPISAAELALLGRLRAGAVALFCVLNKVDYLSAEEVAQARAFTERVVAAELGRPVPVWPVSARHGLDARQRGDETGAAASGLAAFQAAFTGYLTACRDADLLRSVAGRAGRLADAMAEEADATLAALAVSAEDLQRRVAAFSDRLEQVRQGRAESAALAAAEIDRMLAETNEQAAALTREATGPLRHAVLTHLTGLNGPLGEVEQAALEDAAARIRNVVDDWREGRSADLDAALRALEERLSARLDEHIAAVRRTAATLFDLALVTLPPAGRLVVSTRFSYSFAADPGQTEALAAAIRTHLPGAFGRRRVAGHVANRAAWLLDRQVGRARADLQDRLVETRRLLLLALDARFDAGAGRIAEAMRRASLLQDDRGAAAAATRAGLEQRRAVAAGIGDRLGRDAAAVTPTAGDG